MRRTDDGESFAATNTRPSANGSASGEASPRAVVVAPRKPAPRTAVPVTTPVADLEQSLAKVEADTKAAKG